METKENFTKCCGLGGKYKKVFVVVGGVILLAIIFLSVATAGWKMREARRGGNMMYGWNDNSGRGFMGNKGRDFYPTPVSPNIDNQFVLPEDAARNGELAIVVGNLETAKEAVSKIATKSNGNIYATFIAYASNDLKNGSIVVQVPVENFASAFGELKKVGDRVIQESTQQIPPRVYYPMMAAAEKNIAETDVKDDSVEAPQAFSASEAKPEIAIYPAPAQPQQLQNKGYIRVVFADYGNDFGAGKFSQNNGVLWVIFGMKFLLLLVLLALLLVMLRRIFRSLRAVRAAKKATRSTVHIVRQMPKTRSRVIKIAKTVRKR